MFVELHMVQNFAPANLNRDDTGAPKDCEFGGYRRARISSQSIKRAIRTEFPHLELLPAAHRATRTKRLSDEMARRLTILGRDSVQAEQVADTLIKGTGLGLDKEGKTEYLLFLGEREIEAFVDLCDRHWDRLAASAAPVGRATKQAGKEAVPSGLRTAVLSSLNGGRAADLALFGRMLADLPEHNIDAACQVAHAISTNRVSMEFDFYTAVDDLRPEETQGADMLGTVEFNSACFYRYANVDFAQLVTNLQGDRDLASTTLQVFMRASVAAIPTGKQNSMAAQNPPSLVMAVARDRGLWSLANAFLDPVRPGPDGDLVRRSIARLDDYWGKLTRMYGGANIRGIWVATLDRDPLSNLKSAQVDTIDKIVTGVLAAVESSGGRGEAGGR